MSKTRYEKDYVRVAREADLLVWLENGYSLRMSNPAEGVRAPSLIEPGSIYKPVKP